MRLLASLVALSLCACGATLGNDSSSSPGVTVDVVVPSAPPADKTDPPKPAPPAFGYIWVAGHWDNLDGNFIWKAGRWVQARPDYEYVRARYDFDTAKQVWIYHRPHWKRRRQVAAPQLPPAPPPPVAPPADGGTS